VICVAGDPAWISVKRFDHQLRRSDEIVKSAAGDRVPASVNDDCGFDKIRSRNAAMGSCLNGFGAGRRLGLIEGSRSAPMCRRSSRQPALIIKQATVIDCTEGLLEMRRAIFADRQQAICQTTRPFTTHAIEALAHGLRDSDRHTLSSNAR
jgi:hypothetical protein